MGRGSGEIRLFCVTGSHAFSIWAAAYRAIGSGTACGIMKSKSRLKVFAFEIFKHTVPVK